MEGDAKKCAERYCELANTTILQFYKVATPCLDDYPFKKKKWDLLETCQQFALKLFQNACIWHALVDQTILRSVNKLARAVTTWTRARLISYIHHTCEFKQYCHVGNTTH